MTLVELTSAEFKDALSSRQVDVAPLSGPTLVRYLKEYAADGVRALDHGVRDNLGFFYVRTAVHSSRFFALRETLLGALGVDAA